MRINKLFVRPALVVAIGSMFAADAFAQANFTLLHTFSFVPYSPPYVNSEGGHPHGELIVSGNTLYGTARQGTTNGNGTVFAIRTDGSGFTNLHNFGGPVTGTFESVTNSDGALPDGGLALSGTTLYGTTGSGGSSAVGTVFTLNTDGSGFVVLHSFKGRSEGAEPVGALTMSGSTLYGCTYQGGASNIGTLFAINTDGTGFTNLHSFAGFDGAAPWGGLALSGDILYGTASHGGTAGNGTVFAIKTDGTGFTNLYSFSAAFPYATNSGVVYSTNSDGAYPYSGLTLSGNTLCGTTGEGGGFAFGTVFAINTDGSGFRNLHNFSLGLRPTGGYTNNNDGGSPNTGRLALMGHTLYGTTTMGGSVGSGMVFGINSDGTGFMNLHSLIGGTEGGAPWTTPIVVGDVLYGTANYGGAGQSGTVFSILLQPQLAIFPSGTNVILAWPTNATGFIVQSATNLSPTAIWTTNFPAPVVVNGLNTLTNPVSGAPQFFRLSQ